MWTLKLSLTTLWMAGMVAGWTLGGLWHFLALIVLALVLIEETPLERKVQRMWLAHPTLRFARRSRRGAAAAVSVMTVR